MIKSIKKIFFILNKKERISVTLLMIIGFFSSLIEMIGIVMILPIFDILFGENLENYLNFLNPYFNFLEFFNEKNLKIFILIFIFIIFLFKNILLTIVNYFTTKIFFSIQIRIANDLFFNYINSDYSFFLTTKSENILRKVQNDTDVIRTFLISTQILYTELIFIIFLFVFLFFVNKGITIFIILIFFLLFSLYSLIFKKKILQLGELFQDSLGAFQNTILNGILGIKDIIVYNIEKFFYREFSVYNKRVIFSQFKISFLTSLPRFLMEMIVVSSLIIPIIFLIFLDFEIKKLFPIFSLFTISLLRTIPSVNKILSSYNNIKFGTVFLNTYVDDLKILEKIHLKNQDIDSKNYNFNHSIEFKNVQYRYKESEDLILKDINFIIKKNQSVLIAGSNGSGKSTLLNLISGMLQNQSGQILVDGESVILNKKWTKQISYVQQNIFLINQSTMKDNIICRSYDLDYADENKIKNITESLNFKNIFKNFPNILNTTINKNGYELSGGQKQILSVARALYKDSNIIIFDEANSALDEVTKKHLKDMLLMLKGKKTIIFVTHDVDYFKDCFDLIYQITEK